MTSEDGKTQITEKLSKTELKLKLPVASNYTWKVSSSNKDGIESEATAVGQFTILGKAIEEPEIQKPESEFVREVRWSRPNNVSSYDVFVFRLNPELKKWENFKTFENLRPNFMDYYFFLSFSKDGKFSGK